MKVTGDILEDNRYDLIEKYKKELVENTNIETSEKEMEVIDNIMFRLWQMGWLDILEKADAYEARRGELLKTPVSIFEFGLYPKREDYLYVCSRCGEKYWESDLNYCPKCGAIFGEFGNKNEILEKGEEI